MLYYKDLTDNVVYGYDETEDSQLPYIEKAIENGWEDITGSWPLPDVPTAEDNKSTASSLLSETDWVNQPDVADPDNPPYLYNKAEFITYRSLLRAIAINPTDGDLDWPVKPNEVWK